jgi:hypothetical protein
MAIQFLYELPRYIPYVHVKLLQNKLPNTKPEQCNPHDSRSDQ